MAARLLWRDAEAIAELLLERHPDTAPLQVRFTDLWQMVTALPEFADNPKKANEGLLEAIQMAWLELREGRGERRG